MIVFRYLQDKPHFQEKTLAQVRTGALACFILDASGLHFQLWRLLRKNTRHLKYGIYNVVLLICVLHEKHGSTLLGKSECVGGSRVRHRHSNLDALFN